MNDSIALAQAIIDVKDGKPAHAIHTNACLYPHHWWHRAKSEVREEVKEEWRQCLYALGYKLSRNARPTSYKDSSEYGAIISMPDTSLPSQGNLDGNW